MNFVESTEVFLSSANWLTDADAPAVVSLRAAALSLDEALNPPVLAQYRLFYSGLLKRKPAEGDGPTDPLAAALEAANG